MTTYYPHKISLSDGQKVSLARAFGPGEAVRLRFKNEAITGGSDTFALDRQADQKNTARYQKQNGRVHRHEQDTNQTCAQDGEWGRHAGKTPNRRKGNAHQPSTIYASSTIYWFLG